MENLFETLGTALKPKSTKDQIAEAEKQLMDLRIDRLNLMAKISCAQDELKYLDANIKGTAASIHALKTLESLPTFNH